MTHKHPVSLVEARTATVGTPGPPEAVEPLYGGYEIIVFIPDEAGEGVPEAVFDAVSDACAQLENSHPLLRERPDWDLSVEGRMADHSSEVALDRKSRQLAILEHEVEMLRHEVDRFQSEMDRFQNGEMLGG